MGGEIWNLVQTVFIVLLTGLLGVFINQSVSSNERVRRIEIDQAELRERQKATDKNLERIARDIDEIKVDVKQLLKNKGNYAN